jgi:hypothetical protein
MKQHFVQRGFRRELHMKRIVLIALLALALPMVAFAGSSATVDFSNEGGTLTGSSAGLTLVGSTLTGANPWSGQDIIGNIGTVAFSTGSYISTVGNVSTFNGGGSFTITGNGMDGFASGVVFSGSFTGNVTLTFQGMTSNGGSVYEIKGTLAGTMNGKAATGITFEDYVFSGNNGWMGTSTLGSGDTFITPVPEPGTLGLLGTGLVGLAGFVRKKLKA